MKTQTTTIDRRRSPRTEVSPYSKYAFQAYSLKRNIPEQLIGEVLDFSSQGVGIKLISVQSPLSKGDFLYSIQFNLPDSNEVTKAVGVIRSTDTILDEEGHPYWRIGIELINISGEQKNFVSTSEFPVRPQRYEIDQECEALTSVVFQIDNESVVGTLHNVSKFGVAVKIGREAPLRLSVGSYLEGVQIKVDEDIVYTGFLIIRNLRQKKTFTIVGCEVTGSLIDIAKIVENQKIIHYKSTIREKVLAFNNIQTIPNEFKALVADFRYYLEKFENELERPYLEGSKDKVVKEVYPLFKSLVDDIYTKFKSYVEHLSSDDHETYKNYFQKQLHPVLLTSPFIKHTYRKPMGYAGDYEMVLKVLDKEIEGDTFLAKLLNIYCWNMSAAAAHRNRIKYLTDLIQEIICKKDNSNIMVIGSGPAREIQLFLETMDSKIKCSFTLVDFDSRALVYSQEKLLSQILKNKADVKLYFNNKSVRQIIKTKSCDIENGKYDLIYCAGLFDYLSDPFCKKMLEIMTFQLKEEGLLVATNVTELNHYRYFMEFMGEWYLTHRSVDAMLMLVSELQKKYGGINADCEVDNTGVNAFLNVHKHQKASNSTDSSLKECL